MDKTQLLDRAKIKALYDRSKAVQWPDHVFAGEVQKGEKAPIGDMLDQLPNATTTIIIAQSTTHLNPKITMDEAKARMAELQKLATDFSIIGGMLPDESRPLPLAKGAERILAQGWSAFNGDDSYGRFAQDVIERAAAELGLDNSRTVSSTAPTKPRRR